MTPAAPSRRPPAVRAPADARRLVRPLRLLAAGVLLLATTGMAAAPGNGDDGGAATPLRIAVAASFAPALRVVLAGWEGRPVELSTAASGVLATQIRNGAPFDLFLSADAVRPQQLLADGAARPGTVLPYARGRLALWVHPAAGLAPGAPCADWLRTGSGRLAIANPRVAPYGEAALAVLAGLDALERWRGHFVTGFNVAQTWQMADSGAARAALVAASLLVPPPEGCVWVVPTALHAPIEQYAAVPSRTGAANAAAAARLLDWLRGASVQRQLAALGFEAVAPPAPALADVPAGGHG